MKDKIERKVVGGGINLRKFMCVGVFLAYFSFANIMKISENRATPNKHILLSSNIQKKTAKKCEIRKSQKNKKPLIMIKIRSH